MIAKRAATVRRRAADSAGAQALVAHGRALALAGRIAEALRTLETALDAARVRGDAFSEADALELLSWLAWIELDGVRTRAYAQRMLTLKVPATSPAAFRLFVRQATQALQLGRPQAALGILEEAEHVSRDADIDSFIAYLSVKGDVYAAVGKPGVALGHAKLALDIAEKRSDRYQQWRRLEYYGYIQYTNGRLQESLATYRRAEEVAREASLTWEIPFSRIRAAWIAYLLGRMTEAHALIVSSRSRSPCAGWS
jgi:tetratricopeptide (TPR) repeat protein